MAKNDHPAQSRDCYQQLRRLLIHVHIAPGMRLVENDWAERLQVHRTSLREAMSMLAHEGLLRRGERGGFFVPQYDQRDLDEIFAARSIIEAGAIRLLGDRPDGTVDWAPLDASIDAMERMASDGFEMGFLEADRRFHQTLVQLTDNHRLIELYERAPLPLMPSPLPDPQARRQVQLDALGDHRAIARALHERRFDEAIGLLQNHLHQNHRPSPAY